jgi:hypothetical protein
LLDIIMNSFALLGGIKKKENLLDLQQSLTRKAREGRFLLV